MKSVKSAGLIHDNDYAKFPEGTIKNETPTAEGTAVVRELYGDPLTNIYAILKDRGIALNNLEDNELNGYQLLDALRLLVNELNDVEQILTIDAGSWKIGLDFTLLPEKYILFAKASENFNPALTFIKGTAGNDYPFIAVGGFVAGNELMIVLSEAGSVAYNLSALGINSSPNELFTPFGTPLQFMSLAGKIWYQEDGKIFSDKPEIYDIQARISEKEAAPNLILLQTIIIKGNFLCLSFDPDNEIYFFHKILEDFSDMVLMEIDVDLNPGTVYDLHMYAGTDTLYLSNDSNNTPDDYKFSEHFVDFVNNTISIVSSFQLNEDFRNTTNAVIVGKEKLYTLVNGELTRWDFDGNVTIINTFNSFVGVLFDVAGSVYHSVNGVAKKWELL
ncbi:MAG: hypothetical protein V4547_16395 [Bacteroidota bacterium]